MLEEDEWARVSPLLTNQISKIKEYRTIHGCDLRTARRQVHAEANNLFHDMTGVEMENYETIYHHRLALYGQECPGCGHLLRTSRAKYCANCGLKKEDWPKEF
jgi:hypothetical protein